MKQQFDVVLWTKYPKADLLAKVATSIEREIIPFVSTSSFPAQKEKAFVGRILGNQFRIWKVPSSSRSARQKLCIPYFRAEVNNRDGRSVISGKFFLHPFNKLMLFFPAAAVLLPGWLSRGKSFEFLLLWSLLTLCFLIVEFFVIREIRRLRPMEERDIIDFVMGLFPDAVEEGNQRT